MAEPIKPPLSLDRRQLLTSAAVIATIEIVPSYEQVEAASAAGVVVQRKSRPGMSVLSRLAALPEIAKRNRIREEAGLPLLSIPKELRRMKKAEEEAEFEKIGRPIGGGLFH